MMKRSSFRAAAAGLVATWVVATDLAAETQNPNVTVEDDGTIAVPSFDLPFSIYASPESRELTVKRFRTPPVQTVLDIKKQRELVDQHIWMPQIQKQGGLYPYTSTKSVMGGVPVETFVPKAGIAPENRNRVLVNLHGGAFFVGGGGPGGAAESIPIAGLGRIKVIAVDYRQAPEHRFPAASEDVAAVYRELLGSYRSENIGIYGCSAGGSLTGQAIAWFYKERLPMPGAIGILCASAHRFGEGDSEQLWSRLGSYHRAEPRKLDPKLLASTSESYFFGASPTDPLAVPSASTEVMKAFPPALFVTGSRSYEMSSAAQSHLELLELGKKSRLVIFDGMEHGFYNDPIPESTRAHKLVAQFFLDHLGSKPFED